MTKNKILFSSLLALGLTLGLIISNDKSFALTDSDNITMNVNVPNTLEMSLSTNTLTFNDYTGAAAKSASFTVTVNSGLPYNLNAKFLSNIQTADLINKIPFYDVVIESELGTNSVSDKNVNIPLISNHVNGLNVNHFVNVYLGPDNNIKSASYSSSIQIEASQN